MSKRVRSQMITTEKQAERKSKRSSVEYCLLAETLSCTSQNPHYTKLLKAELSPLAKCTKAPPAPTQAHVEGDSLVLISRLSQSRTNSFLCPTSLNEFIIKWSRHNSGPRDMLEEFLLHVSLNTRDVFEASLTDKDSLSSCVIDCKSRTYCFCSCRE